MKNTEMLFIFEAELNTFLVSVEDVLVERH